MIHIGDCREILPTLASSSVHTCVTSPPYFGLRDYGVDGQIGLEASPDAFITEIVSVFREVRRVLRDDGTLWLNLGDSYAGTGGQTPQMGALFNGRARQRENVCMSARIRTDELKPKNLVGMPWRVALALQADGWYLRQDIIWHKPNPMPESVRDRCTKAHEYLFLLSKSPRYYYDVDAIREPVTSMDARVRRAADEVAQGAMRSSDLETLGLTRGKTNQPCSNPLGRNRRSVWTVATRPFDEAHFATFPEALIEPCILAGAPAGGVVLDPFLGAGTTGLVAQRLGRQWVGCKLNPEYAEIAHRRIQSSTPGLALEFAA